MRHILARRHIRKLAEFASSNVLVALDFDGTLAPIVSEPARARMRPHTRRLLAKVARRYPCVVISGRARRDVLGRVGTIPVWHVTGNHGLEPWAQDAAYPLQVQRWVRHLKTRVGLYPGIVIEDKTYSVTVHYRHARHKRRARTAISHAARLLRDARLLDGKDAISLVPRSAPNKGVALERARRLLVCDSAIYVGDDATDEDAFAVARSERLLSIRVGRCARSRADYCLVNQEEVDAFLDMLLTLRPIRHRAVVRHAG
jgi:trehalose 6-phosphate phosphatase